MHDPLSLIACLTVLVVSLSNDVNGWGGGPWKFLQPYDLGSVAAWWAKPYPARIRWFVEAPRYHVVEGPNQTAAAFSAPPGPRSSWLPFAYPARYRDIIEAGLLFSHYAGPYAPER